MERERNLLGRGGMGRTFEVPSPTGERQVEKEFEPKLTRKIIYRLLFGRPHPYSPKNPNFLFALQAAEQRRHMAALLSMVSSPLVEVLDAESTGKGLAMPFIEGRPITYQDKEVFSELDKMAEFFREMGLTDLNLRGPFGLIGWWPLRFLKRGSGNILVTSDEKVIVIDNEEGLPVPDSRWGIRLDDVCHPTLRQGLKQNREKIIQSIGEDGFRQLETAARIEEIYWNSFRDWENSPLVKVQTVIRALQPIYLSATIDWLLEIGQISSQEAMALRENLDNLPHLKQQLARITPHLIFHNLLGFLPPGISSVTRFTYTLGGKAAENLLRKDHKNHTWLVAIASLIPTAGNVAYLIDVIPSQNPKMTRLFLESIAYHGFHTWLDHLIEIWGKRGFSRKSVAIMERVLKRAVFVKRIIGATLEEQFGKEIVEDLVSQFVKAAKSQPRTGDEWPTEICIDNELYFVNWGNTKVSELDPERNEIRKSSSEQTKKIIDFLRDELNLGLCEGLKIALSATP